jgi:hypothetical protein
MNEAITVGNVLAVLGIGCVILGLGYFGYIILKALGDGWSH